MFPSAAVPALVFRKCGVENAEILKCWWGGKQEQWCLKGKKAGEGVGMVSAPGGNQIPAEA